MRKNILIVEDDLDISNLLKIYLESRDFAVQSALDGVLGLDAFKSSKFDLVILDIMMPRLDGYEVIRQIRETDVSTPILVISAKSEVNDKILGLNFGADDYIVKPFDPLEVLARVSALLRRGKTAEDKNTTLTVGELVLNTETLQLKKADEEVIITPNEFKILANFMKSPGKVFTKSQICTAINGEFYENYENVIAVHISRLRDKIETDPKNPKYIINIRGIGYKIEKI